MDDDPVALAGDDLGDQPTVDLQRVERQAAEIGEARIAGAEVVERDLEARFAQPREPPSHGLEVAKQSIFGNLDRDALWIDADRPDFVE